MSDEVLDDVMIKGSCKGKADAIVNCQCNIERVHRSDASRQKDVCSILIISAASSGRGLHS